MYLGPENTAILRASLRLQYHSVNSPRPRPIKQTKSKILSQVGTDVAEFQRTGTRSSQGFGVAPPPHRIGCAPKGADPTAAGHGTIQPPHPCPGTTPMLSGHYKAARHPPKIPRRSEARSLRSCSRSRDIFLRAGWSTECEVGRFGGYHDGIPALWL